MMDSCRPTTASARPVRTGLRLLSLASLAALAGLAAGCGRPEDNQAQAKPPEVYVSTPLVQEVTDYEDFTGRTDAPDTVDIRARVSGYLAKSYLGNNKDQIREGTEVVQGQLLFEIEPVLYEAALEKTQADVAQFEAQKRLLDAQYERNRRLLGTAVSRDEFDTTVAQREQASANIAAAKANIKTAKQNLDWTKVTAPLTGRIGRRMVDPGNLVKADDTILTNIVSQDPMYAYFDIDEHTLLRVRRLVMEGKVKSSREAVVPVLMELADEEDFPHKGVINFSDNKVDAGTGTLRVRAAFSNPNNPSSPKRPRLLSPGMFVRIRLPIGMPHRAILVAERALGTDQGQKYVYVVDKQTKKVAYRQVTVGAFHNGLREILAVKGAGGAARKEKTGLREGEWVIVTGLQRARRDAVVTPRPVPMMVGLAAAGPANDVQTARK